MTSLVARSGTTFASGSVSTPGRTAKKEKARRPSKIEGQAQRKKPLMLTYLLLLALISFKVGCPVEHSLHRLQAALNEQYFPKMEYLEIFLQLMCRYIQDFPKQNLLSRVTSQNCRLCRIHHLTLLSSKNPLRHQFIHHWHGHLCLSYSRQSSRSV
jgi:hypothetical protein